MASSAKEEDVSSALQKMTLSDTTPRDEDGELLVRTSEGRTMLVARDVLLQIPFFAGLLAGRSFKSPFQSDGSLEVEGCSMDCLAAIVSYLKTGSARRLLTDLPRGVAVADLLEQLDFLGLSDQVPPPEDVDELHRELTNVHDEPPSKYEPGVSNRGGRKTARKAATRLCLALPTLDLRDFKMRQRVYNWALFVASHSRTFPPRLRYHFKRTASTFSIFSAKQEAGLVKWKDDSDSDGEEGRYSESESEDEGRYEGDY